MTEYSINSKKKIIRLYVLLSPGTLFVHRRFEYTFSTERKRK